MTSLRALLNVLLALALVASGVFYGDVSAGSGAQAADQVAIAPEATPPCHAQATEAAAPEVEAAMDCCDGGDCTCSCLHHAPVVVNVELLLPAVRYRWVAAIGGPTALRSLALAPAIRPPIA